ncbi:glutathione peroxidase [uncultured Corynebacterium sp.]|uniref:glutathione peroxidase n=1 Tax=uncultured Corynebacterium sp. TaxID=159447 RepID=UPI0025ECB54D|nr:glutathione peroxidase [uncultured Corynebacterium sp.]
MTENTTDTTDIKSIPVTTLAGDPLDLHDFTGPLLIVNVASRCGLTPQYTALERLQETYGAADGSGLTVLGVPCNQFAGQEPGSAEEIATFCSTTYGVTFPLLAKTDVNGDDRDPLYQALTATQDADGEAGDIQWNFEKFLVSADGRVLNRFRPQTTPDDPAVIAAIDAAL